MIQAIVLDVDGVIVGTKQGENYPMPSTKISKILKKIHDDGVPVAFCSAKSSFAITETIKHVDLDNIHIADGGAVLYNPIRSSIIFEKKLDKEEIRSLLEIAKKYQSHVFLFSPTTYYSLESSHLEFISKHSELLGRSPEFVADFEKVISQNDIVKMLVFVFDEENKNNLDAEMKNTLIKISYAWGTAPILAPAIALVVTQSGVSKRSGVEELAHRMNISLQDILAVGDNIQDWDFIEICGYKGTLANASEELKNKFNLNDPHQFMGSHVDEDGLIDVLKHFKLIQ